MKPQLQRTKTDCLRACIASLLDYEIEDVPDFTRFSRNGDEGGLTGVDNWWIDLQSWLMDRGLFFLEVHVGGKMEMSDGAETIKGDIHTLWNPLPFPCLAILCGPSKSGLRHMIIGTCEGSKFMPQFNPLNGKDDGITEVHSVCFLVPRDPGLAAKLNGNMSKIEKMASASTHPMCREIRYAAREALGKPNVNVAEALGQPPVPEPPRIIPADVADLHILEQPAL